jgi:hypothetical protein
MDSAVRVSPSTAAALARYLGGVALLGVGVDHIEQYWVDSYAAIPTIGTLFALNFASAAILALGLLVPIRDAAASWARAGRPMLAVGGIGIAGGSLVGLLYSESVGLFAFTEPGYRSAVVVALALEAATMFLLGAFVALNRRVSASHRAQGTQRALSGAGIAQEPPGSHCRCR